MMMLTNVLRQQRQKCNSVVSTCCTDVMLDLGKHFELVLLAWSKGCSGVPPSLQQQQLLTS
jgi:hypothetical protein